jgi:hypothetical protein
VECLWCENIIQGRGVNEDFCSIKCRDEASQEYEIYLDKFNDYMAGYPVTFEKIKRKKKEEQ